MSRMRKSSSRDTPLGHTPGPWETVGASKVWSTGANGGAVAIIAEPQCLTSGHFKQVDIGSARWDEAMANARLIAAAPDLLAACELSLSWHHGDKWRDGAPDQRRAWEAQRDRLEAAVKKARGE